METLIQDIRFGIRRLLKSKGFALIAVLSLALGIGANTAIFSLVNTVLFRPFPVRNSNELVSVSLKGKKAELQAFSYPNYKDFRDRNEVLSGLYLTRIVPLSLSRNGVNERLWGNLASGNYFDVLGVGAALGRTFTQADDQTKLGHPVVVLSHKFWQKSFGSDPSVIGQDVILNGHSYKIIGVTPKGFQGTDLVYFPDIWIPMMMQSWIEPGNDWLERRGTQNCFAIGRLKPGVSREQAEASLNVLASQLAREYPDEQEGQVVELVPPGFIIPNIRGAFVSFSGVLMVTVTLVLLIACTNLAGLLLARAAERRKEIAVRLAIGAGRWRLIRQLLTESVLLALIGGVLGVLLASWLLELIVAFKPPMDIPLTIELNLDWRVMAFSLLVSLLTGIVFGLAPALQSTNPQIVPALKDVASQSGYRRSFLRSSLVVVQIALSVILLIAAGLVVRALQQVQTLNPGFEVENALVLSFDPGLQGYDQAKGEQFQRQLLERVQTLPGVRSVTMTDLLPLSLNMSSNGYLVEGQAPVRGTEVPLAMVASIGLNYFATMETPLLAGRDFNEQDTDKTTKVVVVNEAFVHRFFPQLKTNDEALGRRISTRGLQGPWLQIAGVAKTGKYWTLSEAPQPFVWYPIRQSYSSFLTLIVRTAGDPKAISNAVRSEFQKLDATLPVYNVKTLSEHMGVSLFPARIAAGLLGSFGLLALTLAGIGIYGVTAYSVAQRTREVGIRMALGASPLDVLRLIVRQGMILALIGLSVGVGIALMLSRLMSSVLYGVSATDVVTFVAVPLMLLLIVLLACYLPARRAMKVDPMIALRYE